MSESPTRLGHTESTSAASIHGGIRSLCRVSQHADDPLRLSSILVSTHAAPPSLSVKPLCSRPPEIQLHPSASSPLPISTGCTDTTEQPEVHPAPLKKAWCPHLAAPWRSSSRSHAYMLPQSDSQRTSASHGAPRSNASSLIGSAVLPIPSWLQGRNVVVPAPDHTPLKFSQLSLNMASLPAPFPGHTGPQGIAAFSPSGPVCPSKAECDQRPMGMRAHIVAALRLPALPRGMGDPHKAHPIKVAPPSRTHYAVALVLALFLVALVSIIVPFVTSAGLRGSTLRMHHSTQNSVATMTWLHMHGGLASVPGGLPLERALELTRWRVADHGSGSGKEQTIAVVLLSAFADGLAVTEVPASPVQAVPTACVIDKHLELDAHGMCTWATGLLVWLLCIRMFMHMCTELDNRPCAGCLWLDLAHERAVCHLPAP
jgi:hypothetical protein